MQKEKTYHLLHERFIRKMERRLSFWIRLFAIREINDEDEYSKSKQVERGRGKRVFIHKIHFYLMNNC
ncbi:hypothetical protein B4168_1751 [Anoxybacillus flavithermus]|nr:hypothetical protein B4168_1751 [Anoxybacillus flavithermus]OAO84770.1 hypothetical protein GT23_3375 [Parageobacillus thermoglucosidasius]